MNETALKIAVHKHLPRQLHRQSMTHASVSFAGTLDMYYDGPKSDLWIEYKQLDYMPRSGYVNVAPVSGVKKQPKGHLTYLQLAWLKRRSKNGDNAVVVVGLPNRTAILLDRSFQWENNVSVDDAGPLTEISRWICDFCGV